jgi:membrane-bound ClpP family serine protease
MIGKNSIFMALMMLFGIGFLGLSTKVRSDIKSGCTSDKLRNANLGVMMMAVLLITLSICYFICVSKCNCGDVETYSMIYSGISLAIGFVMIVLGAIIAGESKAGCKSASANSIWQIGILITVAAAGTLGYQIYEEKNSNGKRSKSKVEMTKQGFSM